MELAKDLAATCFEMYNSTATGLAPEIAYFNDGAGMCVSKEKPLLYRHQPTISLSVKMYDVFFFFFFF